MGSVHDYTNAAGKRLWRVSYRKPGGRQGTKRGFERKRDAQAYLAEVETSINHSAYIAPADAKATIGTLGTAWLAAHKAGVKPSTYHADESSWRLYVEAEWGKRKVGSIKHSEVAAWVAKLSAEKSPTTVKRCHGILAAILDVAVRDRRIAENPARQVKTPRKAPAERGYLTHQQVERLAKESRYPDVVRFLAYTGLRWGEMAGLRVKHIDATRRRVTVAENAVIVNGHVEVGTPKTHEQRIVPYPAFLDDAISSAMKGKKPAAILFDAELGGYLRPGNAVSGWFAAAVKRVRAAEENAAAEAEERGEPVPPIMPRVTAHDLRHTAVSLAISAGANVKAVQRMLGHASAAMTLDTYADLFEDDLDEVAGALDKHRADALA